MSGEAADMSFENGSTCGDRLVHITTVPWSLFFLRNQARFMTEQGFEVTIISSPGEALDRFGEAECVATRSVTMRRAISPIMDLRSMWGLVKELRTIKPSIVHAHTPKGGLLGMICSWLLRTPVRIYHIRGLPHMTASGPRRALLATSEWLACRLASRVFCVSESIRKVAVSDGLCDASKIIVFLGGSGNGVDADGRFNPDRFPSECRNTARAKLGIGVDDSVVGFVGWVVKDKGVEELFTAWSSLRERFPNSWWIIIGPQETKDAISPATRQALESDPRIILVGDVPDPSEYYALMDVLVLPTYREGFGNVLIEAAAMRVPQVATHIPGCVDAVDDGKTGTLVPPRSSGELERAIATYLSDPALRRRHGDAGRQRALEQFRQEDIWESIRLEYVRLLAETQHKTP